MVSLVRFVNHTGIGLDQWRADTGLLVYGTGVVRLWKDEKKKRTAIRIRKTVVGTLSEKRARRANRSTPGDVNGWRNFCAGPTSDCCDDGGGAYGRDVI